jgi:hypothetical protein
MVQKRPTATGRILDIRVPILTEKQLGMVTRDYLGAESHIILERRAIASVVVVAVCKATDFEDDVWL